MPQRPTTGIIVFLINIPNFFFYLTVSVNGDNVLMTCIYIDMHIYCFGFHEKFKNLSLMHGNFQLTVHYYSYTSFFSLELLYFLFFH